MAAKIVQERENGSRLEIVCSDEELTFITESLLESSNVLRVGASNFKSEGSTEIKASLEKKSRKLLEMSRLISLLIGDGGS